MEKVEQINLFIYLKGIKKPFHAIVSSQHQIDDLINNLNTKDIIEFGQIIFAKSEFRFIKVY